MRAAALLVAAAAALGPLQVLAASPHPGDLTNALAYYSRSSADALSYSNGHRNDSEPGWVDPSTGGGSMLDLVHNGMREPINVIISGLSDPYILSDAGLRDYVRSIGFSFECLDLHIGNLQRADLGDGRGWQTEMFEYRQTGRWDPGRWVGSCAESLLGGNHFRAWKQRGPAAKTGAWFLAVSKEKSLRYDHTIDEDGYNVGRDLMVASSVQGGRWKTFEWKADVEWVEGLLAPGKHGINHHVAQDGKVAVLTVKRLSTSANDQAFARVKGDIQGLSQGLLATLKAAWTI